MALDIMRLLAGFQAGQAMPQEAQGIPPPMQPQPPQADETVAAIPPIERRGMFGVRGTARDIIGAIGDAFLAQGGRQAVYQPRRQMEREADAQQEFTRDPMAAIERLSRENPAGARDMYNDHVLNEARAQQARNARMLYENTTRDRAARIGRGGSAEDWPRRAEALRRYYDARGVEPSEPIPDVFDQGYVDRMTQGALDVDDQVDNENLADYRTQQISAARLRHTESIGVRREGNAIRRDQINRTDADRDASREQRGNRDRWFQDYSERYPRGSGRRPAPGGRGGGPRNPVNGGRYREEGTGRIYIWRNGQKEYQ